MAEHHHQVDDDEDGLHAVDPVMAKRARRRDAGHMGIRARLYTMPRGNSTRARSRLVGQSGYRRSAAMARKSAAFRLAPPTSAPFTSATAINSAALPGFTEPP